MVQPRPARGVRALPGADRRGGDRLQGRLHRGRGRGPVVRRLQRRRLRVHPEPVPVQPLLPPGAASRRAAAGADDRDRDAGLQRGGRGRRLDPLAAGGRLPAGEARDRGRQRRLHRRHAARDPARSRTASRGRAGDRLPGEPRQARRDGGRHPRDRAPRSIAFVDSDSSLERDALRHDRAGLRRPARGRDRRPRRGARTRASRWITRMQAVRYFVAFRVCKAAESIFGAVTCCSGCFSAYRREAIAPGAGALGAPALPRAARRPTATTAR